MMRRRSAKDKELEDNARLLRKNWHRDQFTEALAGMHHDVLERLIRTQGAARCAPDHPQDHYRIPCDDAGEPAGAVRQIVGVMKMSSDLTIKIELDGFNNFTDEIEGDDSSNMSPRVIQGTRIKYLDPDWWIGEQKITGMLLTVINVLNVATKWGHDNKPLETQILVPGEKFPAFDKRNAECPDSEWRTVFGKAVGPWSGQHCLYLVDEHLNPYTWASPITTIGSAIAVRELVDQIKRVRRFKGRDVYPVVELGHTHFPNAYKPDRERPSLLPIKRLVKLGPDRTADVLPAPTTAALASADNASMTTTQDAPTDASATPQGAPADAKTVAPISCAEELNDEIPW